MEGGLPGFHASGFVLRVPKDDPTEKAALRTYTNVDISSLSEEAEPREEPTSATAVQGQLALSRSGLGVFTVGFLLRLPCA